MVENSAGSRNGNDPASFSTSTLRAQGRQAGSRHHTIKGMSKTDKSISSSVMEMDLMEQGEHNGFAVAS